MILDKNSITEASKIRFLLNMARLYHNSYSIKVVYNLVTADDEFELVVPVYSQSNLVLVVVVIVGSKAL